MTGVPKERHERYLRRRSKRQSAMADEPAPTTGHVRDVVLASADARTGGAGGWAVEGPLARGRDSWVFRASTPLAPWPLAVKIFCSATSPDRVEKRFRQLQDYHAGLAPGPLTVPAPWAVLREHRAMISEWIGEPQASTLLRQAGRRRQRRAEILEAAGRWLGRFHDHAGIRPLPLDPARLRWHVDRMLGGREGAGQQAGDGVFRQGYETLQLFAEEVSDLPVAHAACHGDFTPANLFHGPARTVGFDFAVLPDLPVSFDICRFLAGAETAKPFWTRRRDLSPQGLERPDLEAFMAGYGRLELSERVFSYLHLAEVLRRWASLIGQRPARRFGIARRVRLQRLRRMAAHSARHLREGR